jgi:hypothetical protein
MHTISAILTRKHDSNGDYIYSVACPKCKRTAVLASRPDSDGIAVLRYHGECDVLPVRVAQVFRHRIGDYIMALKSTAFARVNSLRGHANNVLAQIEGAPAGPDRETALSPLMDAPGLSPADRDDLLAVQDAARAMDTAASNILRRSLGL